MYTAIYLHQLHIEAFWCTSADYIYSVEQENGVRGCYRAGSCWHTVFLHSIVVPDASDSAARASCGLLELPLLTAPKGVATLHHLHVEPHWTDLLAPSL